MTNLALFDFDGTITTADTFTPFIRYAVAPKRFAFGTVLLSPLLVGYKLGLLSSSLLRKNIVKFGFLGTKELDIRRLGLNYSRLQLDLVVRQKALERIRWHKSQGDTVAIVSASLNVYLSDWCTRLGVDLICSELESHSGILTGRYLGGDCTREEKSKRVRQKYEISIFPLIYAYGDTEDDEDMLRLAHKKYFRWREVHDVNAAIGADNTSRLDPNHKNRMQKIEQENIGLEQLVANQSSEQ
ncbi:MAG: HAD-IB family hydrolase [Proteobacteria bacterium]|nr:HAD-IB family hydrolase [Pseudomonadota bacterium]